MRNLVILLGLPILLKHISKLKCHIETKLLLMGLSNILHIHWYFHVEDV